MTSQLRARRPIILDIRFKDLGMSIRLNLSSLLGKCILCCIPLALSVWGTLQAQEPPLLVVGNDSVSRGEFLYLWKRHLSYTSENKPETVEGFLQMYINYRLKVLDAKAQGLEKQPSLQAEYQQYRDLQLTPYFLDSTERERLYRAAYERMQWEVDASHILLSVHADTEDSLVYNRALAVRKQLLHGANFDSLARAISADPSAARNGGNLGYFGAFMMVHPFELAAYNTPVDSFSMPVRTSYGYHILRVNGRRPARGKMKVAHIMRTTTPKETPERERQILDTLALIRKRYEAGESFTNLVKTFSQDQASIEKDGVLPLVTLGRYPNDFVDVVFALKKDGDLSEPYRSPYGWYLMQRLEHIPLPSYQESREEIRRSLQRVGIELEGRGALLTSMLRTTGATHSEAAVLSLVGASDTIAPAEAQLAIVFANVGGKELRLRELYAYMIEKKLTFQKLSLLRAAQHLLEQEAFRQCEARIRRENPTLDYALREFYNGLLLFDISERKLWQTDPSQEAAFKSLYKRHKKELTFQERLRVEEYSTPNATDKLDALRARICSKKDAKVKVAAKELERDSIKVKTSNYEAGITYFVNYRAEKPSPTALGWSGDCSLILRRGGNASFFRVLESKKGAQKSYEEARGDLQRLFQEEEEKRWLDALRKQYTVWVDQTYIKGLQEEK